MQQTTGSRSAEHVRPGQVAPSFAAPASTGRMLWLEDFLGKVPVALTFTGTLRAREADELIVALDRILAEFGQSLIEGGSADEHAAAVLERVKEARR